MNNKVSARFGPAGNPDAFHAAGYKASVDMPLWLKDMGLNAYEYQCGHGVRIKEETARAIGEAARQQDVQLSLHAPYYISLATEDEETAANTRRHFHKSLETASWLGADRVVFHMGGIGKKTRREAMELAKRRFDMVLEDALRSGMGHIFLAPETHGKGNQLGTVAEVIELCQAAPQVIPAIDFGHLHAVANGGYNREEEYERVFDQVGEALGAETAQTLHIHFSQIEFTPAGEKRHWTFQDGYGPDYHPLLHMIARRGFAPRIICESAGTQGEDARKMQQVYLSAQL